MTFYLRRRLRVVALAAFLTALPVALLLQVMGSRRTVELPAAPAAPGLSGIDCWFEGALPTTCAWLVPSIQDSTLGTALPVVILHPADAGRSHKASIYLAGGPGGSSYLYEEGMDFWAEWRDALGLDHDLVLYDARGTGYAVPELACDEYQQTTRAQLAASAATIEQQTRLWRDYEDAIRACVAKMPAADVAANLHSTPVHARDLLELIRELRSDYGYDEVVLYGVSYGTRLAVEAAALAADEGGPAIARLVLDSYYPPGTDLTLRTAQTWTEVLDDYPDYCAATSACTVSAKSLRAQVQDMIDAPPLQDQVREVDLGELAGEDRLVAIRLDAFNLVEMLMFALSANLAPEQLSLRVQEARAGQWTPEWQELALAYVESRLDWGFNPVAFELAECADTGEPAAEAASEVLANYPHFDELLADIPETRGYCERLGVKAARLAPRTVDIDALVVSMQLDPVTPWRAALAALPRLPRAEWRRITGAGHGVANSDDCATRAIGAYMNSGDLSAWGKCDLVDTPTSAGVAKQP